MFKRLVFLAVLAVVLLASIAGTPGASADSNYGRDAYGKCDFSRGCKHTVISTPSGLEIAVNLVANQEIPSTGYEVIITPLNGAGTSFQKVDIYIGNTLAATVAPDETGTAHWHWDPKQFPGDSVRVVATDKNGKTVTKNFAVRVLPPELIEETGGDIPAVSSPAPAEHSSTSILPVVGIISGVVFLVLAALLVLALRRRRQFP
jgi:hypothetical protein